MASESSKKPLRLFILRPTMGGGGADRVTLILLKTLDRTLFDLSLVLMRAEGVFLSEIPDDVKVYSLRASNVLTSTLPLLRLLRAHKPDVLFSTSSGMNIPAVIAHKLSRQTGRLVLSERNTLYHGGVNLKRVSVVLLKRGLYRSADSIISLSEGVKDELVSKLGLPPELISVAYSPVDTESIERLAGEPVEHPWFGEGIPIILGAGRFVREKDFPTLIKAFALARDGRPLRLVILGEGPLKDDLKEMVSSLGLASDAWFAGFDKNPFKYMARCAIFVVSSKHEGLCTLLIQAMASGAAVITTDYQVGAREVIDAGVDGLIVPVGDAAALAEQIRYLLDNEELRRRLGEAARHSAQRFSPGATLHKHVAALLDHKKPVHDEAPVS